MNWFGGYVGVSLYLTAVLLCSVAYEDFTLKCHGEKRPLGAAMLVAPLLAPIALVWAIVDGAPPERCETGYDPVK